MVDAVANAATNAATEALATALARIAEREPIVQAWAHVRDARLLTEESGTLPDGRMHGWTVGVKDVIDTFDAPTERGSPIYADRRSGNDAACVSMIRAAGAQVIGKTRTTEFALFTPTVTTNPHDPDRTPGGSSSGSAAAVADGMVRAAFGTQTVGSVIRPAAYCGVVGFKPTHQLVPLTGVATLAQSLDTLGWFTQTVADSSTILRVLTGLPSSPRLANPRIGLYPSHQSDAADPDVALHLDQVAASLRSAGATVVEVAPLPHLEPVFDAADLTLLFESARVFHGERRGHWDLISPLLQRMLLRSDTVAPDDYGKARRVLSAAAVAHDEWMEAAGFDALLTPAAPGEAPPLATTGDSVFNRTWSALGVPAVTVPAGVGPAGLPQGAQLTGPRWTDTSVLAIAEFAEQALTGSPI